MVETGFCASIKLTSFMQLSNMQLSDVVITKEYIFVTYTCECCDQFSCLGVV